MMERYVRRIATGIFVLAVSFPGVFDAHARRNNNGACCERNGDCRVECPVERGLHSDRSGWHEVLSDKAFSRLSAIVGDEAFAAEKLRVIEVAALGGWFTSAQCAALMSQFDFDDNKLDVLRLIAPRLVDTRDAASTILSQFMFDSARATATELLLNRP